MKHNTICVDLRYHGGGHKTITRKKKANGIYKRFCEELSKSYYDWRSVSQYVLVSSSLWNLWPDIIFCLKVAVLSLWGALSDERSGLSLISYCEQYNAYFPRYDIDHIEHDTPHNSSAVTGVSVVAVTILLSCCLTIVGDIYIDRDWWKEFTKYALIQTQVSNVRIYKIS
jgi:hypothetical protein